MAHPALTETGDMVDNPTQAQSLDAIFVTKGDKVVVGEREYLCRSTEQHKTKPDTIRLWYNGRWNDHHYSETLKVVVRRER